mmetsp:Transcript_4860/g.17349  ORF Transcript_4860/g.17349 Transcript_4860/m.17349 type:complete len:213 (-) Transcript_4860:324-962(-)
MVTSSRLRRAVVRGLGTTLSTNLLTESEYVAEKHTICGLLLRNFWMLVVCVIKFWPLSISSASSRTNILTLFGTRSFFLSASKIFPGVPTKIWCVYFSLLRFEYSGPVAIALSGSGTRSMARTVVFAASSWSTWKFCTASSRVGHTQIACGAAIEGSTRASMPRQNAAVLPVPDCACPIKLRGGSSSIRGMETACIIEGLSYPFKYTPSNRA